MFYGKISTYFEEKRWFASNCTFVLVLVHGLENGIEFKVFVNIESWALTEYFTVWANKLKNVAINNVNCDYNYTLHQRLK